MGFLGNNCLNIWTVAFGALSLVYQTINIMTVNKALPNVSDILKRCEAGIKEYSKKAEEVRAQLRVAERSSSKELKGIPARNFKVVAEQYERMVVAFERSRMWANHSIYFREALEALSAEKITNPTVLHFKGYSSVSLEFLANGYLLMAEGSRNYRFTVKKSNESYGIFDNFLSKWEAFSSDKEALEQKAIEMNLQADVELL
jgi:hypothetical protein